MRGRATITTTANARRLRRDQTDVENRLWQALRARSFVGAKFRRQLAIGRYIADFACPSRRLIVELDGGQHAALAPADAARSRALAAHGYRVIRFWNNDVNENLAGVLATIESALADPSIADPSPQPSPRSRGAREPFLPSPRLRGEGRVRGIRVRGIHVRGIR